MAPSSSSSHPRRTPRTRSRRATLAAAGAISIAAALAAGTGSASASSHREAPNVSGSPRLDTTDVYAFLSPDKKDTATLIADWIPFEEPAGGPNFYTFADGAHYDIDVDTNGNGKPDIIYRWEFSTKIRNNQTFLYNTGPVTSLDDPDLNIRQTYDLSVYKDGKWTTIARDRVAAPSNVGKASFPNYADLRKQATYNVGDATVFAGQADDPFFLDLRVFNLAYGGNLSEVGNDTLKGYNVNSVAIQVPVSELGGAKNVIGVWSETSAKSAGGDYKRVSRLGNPLVNEVVVPVKDKDTFNASRPQGDAQFAQYVTKPSLPKVLNKLYNLPVPAEPRNDLVQVFLTGVPGVNQPATVTPAEELRLNLTPFSGDKDSRLGVIGGDRNGFPNGRRLSDDVVDAALQVVEGELVGKPNDLGDGVNTNDMAFGSTFPYLALPNSGSSSVNSGAGSTAQNSSLVSPLQGGRPDSPDSPAQPAGSTAPTTALSAALTGSSHPTAAIAVPAAATAVAGVGLIALARRRRARRATA